MAVAEVCQEFPVTTKAVTESVACHKGKFIVRYSEENTVSFPNVRYRKLILKVCRFCNFTI